MRESEIRFIRQQGFSVICASPDLYTALMFQPRIIGVLLAAGVLLQSAWFFLALSGVLGWSALAPAYNPFDAIYNRVIANPRGGTRLSSAPPPRRFAQGLAAIIASGIAAALFLDATTAAWVFEGMFGAAVLQVVFRRMCAGAELYHVLRRRLDQQRRVPGTSAMNSFPGTRA